MAVNQRVLLITEQGVAEFGKQMTFVAVPLVAVVSLHGGPLTVSTLFTAIGLASIFGALLNAAVVKVISLRVVVLIATTVSTVSLAAIPIMSAVDVLNVYTLTSFAAVVTMVAPAYRVGIVALVPRIVADEDLVSYNGRITVVHSVAAVAGPLFAGVALLAVSPTTLLVLDAATWCFSGVVLTVLLSGSRTPAAPTNNGHANETGVMDYRMSKSSSPLSAHLRAQVMAGISAEAAWALCRSAVLTLAVLFIVDSLHFSPSVVGVVYAIGSVGFLVGASVAAFASRLTISRAAVLASMAAAVCAVSLAATPLNRFVGVGGMTVFVATSAMGYIVLEVSLTSWRQMRLSSDQLRVISSVSDGVGSAVRVVGALVAGLLAAAFGVRSVVVGSGVLFVGLTVIVWYMSIAFRGFSAIEPTNGLSGGVALGSGIDTAMEHEVIAADKQKAP